MTLPNKEEGITPGVLFATSFPAGTTYDLLDPDGTTFGGLTERLDWRTQPNVVEFLKARVQQMSSWNQSTADVWGGLRRGTPGSPVSLVLATVEGLAQRFLPIDLATEFDTVEDALGAFAEGGEALWEFLGGLNPFDPAFDPEQAIEDFIQGKLLPTGLFAAAAAAWGDLLEELTGGTASGNPLTDLNSLGNFLKSKYDGIIDPNRLGAIPLTAIGNFAANLLNNPSFLDENAITNPGDFIFDALTGHSTSGSAQTTADGTTKTLYSNFIPVDTGQVFNVGSWVRWTGLTTTTADPLQLNILEYVGDSLQRVLNIGALGGNGGSSSNAGENDFVQIFESYEVPANITRIAMELRVKPDATAGTVNFDDGLVSPTRLLQLDWVNGLTGYLSKLDPTGILDLATGVIGEISNVHVPGLTQISDQVHQALINPNTLSGGIEEIQSNLQALNDSIRQGAEGVPSTGAIVNDLLSALTGLREAQSSTATRLSQIESRIPNAILGGSGVVGNQFTDDAERAPAQGWGPGWLTLGPTSPYGVSSDGHQWHWTDNSNVQRTQPGIYTAGQTLTDYQIVRDTMTSLMESPQAWTGDGPASANGLIARSNVTGTEWVVAARFYNAVALYKHDDGVYTQIGTHVVHTPRAGARWELRAGDPVTLNLNKYILLMNDAVVAVWEDTGATIPVDANHRYGGEYMQSDDRNTGEATPGSIGTWSIADNPPPGPMVGSGARVARVATAAYNMASQTGLFPASNYDTTSGANTGISPDITFTAASNRYTAIKAGQYVVKIGQKHANLNGNAFQLLLYKNGALYERGAYRTQGTESTEMFIVWLNKDEYIEPGYFSNVSGAYFFGTTDGADTYFAATLSNQGSL